MLICRKGKAVRRCAVSLVATKTWYIYDIKVSREKRLVYSEERKRKYTK